MATAERTDFVSLDERDAFVGTHEGRFELVDGEIREKPAMGMLAAGVAENLR